MNNNVTRFPIVAMLLLLACGKEPTNGRGDLAIRPFFASAVEARQHVIGMILTTDASPYTTIILRGGSPTEDVKPDFRAAYAAAYLRTYQPRDTLPMPAFP